MNELTDDGGVIKTTVIEGDRWEQPKGADEVLGAYHPHSHALTRRLAPSRRRTGVVVARDLWGSVLITIPAYAWCRARATVSYKVSLPNGTLIKEEDSQEFQLNQGALRLWLGMRLPSLAALLRPSRRQPSRLKGSSLGQVVV